MENEVITKKKDKKLIIIIVVLLIGLLGLSSYVVYDKCFKTEKKKEVVKKKPAKKEEEKEITITDVEKETLMGQIKEYLDLAGSYPINDVDDLDDQLILRFAFKHLQASDKDTFKREDLENVINKYFKENINIVYGDINCFAGDGILYKYDATEEKYSFFGTHGHGGEGFPSGKVFYISSEVNDNEYTVKVNILYRDYCSDICGPVTTYYKNASDAQNNTNPVFTLAHEGDSITDGEYQSIKDTLPVVIFNFVKADNNYGLESVKVE